VRHAYDRLLRLYPEAFRHRYGVEMSLDFADGWAEARANGSVAVIWFASRVAGDLAVSLLREWTRGVRLVIVAATASVTLLIWGLAFRPWAWKWDIQPGPPHAVVTEVTAAQLMGLAAAAMLPVILVLLFATRLVKRREVPRRRF
jgi:hypothetical protein